MKKQESINVEPAMMSPETPTFKLTGDFDAAKAQKSMKGKAAVLTGLIGLGGLSIVATGCQQPTGGGGGTPSCNCPSKQHLGIGDSCGCGIATCLCVPEIHGSATKGTVSIPIYREGISANLVTNQVLQNIQEGLNNSEKQGIGITAIYLFDGDSLTSGGFRDGILRLAYQAPSSSITNAINNANGITFILPGKDTIKLSKAPVDTKAFGHARWQPSKNPGVPLHLTTLPVVYSTTNGRNGGCRQFHSKA